MNMRLIREYSRPIARGVLDIVAPCLMEAEQPFDPSTLNKT
jgi:hypothetical protein